MATQPLRPSTASSAADDAARLGEPDSAKMIAMLPSIELLADSGSLARGRDYFRQGRVVRFKILGDGAVEGVVEGEHFYRVRIMARSWECDCPMGASGAFCKHCVAVTLAAEAGAEAGAEPGAMNRAVTARPAPPPDLRHGDTTGLAEVQKAIVAAFRSRRNFYDWRSVEQYADIAEAGIQQLGEAARRWGAGALIPTAQKSIAAAVRVIQRADDSNGVIGYLIDQLLDLHAELCTQEPPPAKKLVHWLIDFQFDGRQDFFTPDVAAYADALGTTGLTLFETRLRSIQNQLPLAAAAPDLDRLLVRHNLQRLAVARRDPDAVIDSFDELSRSYQLHDAAKALVEIGAIDLALEYANRGAVTNDGWQAEKCAHYWCELLAEHRSHDDEVDARRWVFERWPTASNALTLARMMGAAWESIAEDAYARLASRSIRDLIEALLGLGLDERAWLSAQGEVLDAGLWTRLVAVREVGDPAAVLPILRHLIDSDLEVADARNCTSAAKRLKQLRQAMAAAGVGDDFADIVAELRERHKRRPRFLEELRKARL